MQTMFPFSGIATFAKVPLYDPAEKAPQVVILGIPYDEGTTNHPGARMGPRAIREASTLYPYYKRGRGYFDIEEGKRMLADVEIRDGGDVDIVPTLGEENFRRMTEAVKALLDRGLLPLCLGGDNSITPAILKAFEGRRVHLVQFDAHLDFVDHFQGAKMTHGSPMRRAIELPQVKGLTQLGVRSIVSAEEDYLAAKGYGSRILTTEAIALNFDPSPLFAEGEEIYLTFDIDVFDPAFAPGTGFPEPGGLSYREARRALKALARRCRIVGMDLVEVNPYLDGSRITATLASRLILDTLSFIFDERGPHGTEVLHHRRGQSPPPPPRSPDGPVDGEAAGAF